MSTKKNFPLPVENLRVIWDKKRIEMRFTQVEAAKILGWSQGGISHYLNDLTELGQLRSLNLQTF